MLRQLLQVLIVSGLLSGCAAISAPRLVELQDPTRRAGCDARLTAARIPVATSASRIEPADGGFFVSDEAMAILEAKARQAESQRDECEIYRQTTCSVLLGWDGVRVAERDSLLVRLEAADQQRRYLQAGLGYALLLGVLIGGGTAAAVVW